MPVHGHPVHQRRVARDANWGEFGKRQATVSPKTRFGAVRPQRFCQMAIQKAVRVKVPKGVTI